MNIVSLPLPVVSVTEAEIARGWRVQRAGSDLAPETRTSGRSPINLARPWKFPAGHADSIRCRRHPRSSMEVPVRISLLRRDGSSYDQGSGVIRDLSYSGLRLGDVFLTQGRLLAMYFGVELRHALEPTGADPVAGRILHTYSSGFPGLGIEFLSPESGAEARLRERR